MTLDDIDARTAVPLVCADFELSDPALPDHDSGDGLALLVRLHGEPLGDIDVEPAVTAAGLAAVGAAVRAEFAAAIAAHCAADGIADGGSDAAVPVPAAPEGGCVRSLSPADPDLSVTVMICTLGKHPLLPTTLRSLLAQDFTGSMEILLVDNAPATGAALAVLAELGEPAIRYTAQPTPGLSNARNAGLAVATGDVVAFTDDDVIADPAWVRSIVSTFAESGAVDAVTGLVMPGSLRSYAEQMFESACGFNKGYRRVVWSTQPAGSPIYRLGPKGSGGPLFPFAAGRFGSGNNMALRRSSIARLGGFDPAMWCSEDIDVFFRLIFAGGVLIYEPRALVRHFHRETYDALVKQMSNYGVGFTSFLTKQTLHTRGAAAGLIRAVPKAGKAAVTGKRTTAVSDDALTGRSMPEGYPKQLVRTELAGMAKGPYRYLRDRHRIKAALRSGHA